MLTRGDKGPEVTGLQKALVFLGYKLPRWGADGKLGNETLDAVSRFLLDHAKDYKDADRNTVSDYELNLIAQVCAAVNQQKPQALPGIEFHDMRKAATRDGVGGRRQWTQITGITLHQTACDFGHEKPDRWDTLHAHVGASREGKVFWVHDFEFVVYHGNELNGFTVGLECEGNYPGVVGDHSSVWQPGGGSMMSATPELVNAAQEAIEWICATVAAHGGKVTNLYAHRQTAGSRRADPGEELWKQVALPVLSRLSLTDGGSTFKIDNGRPIPQAWNPAYTGNAY
jgi:hypothetical protein